VEISALPGRVSTRIEFKRPAGAPLELDANLPVDLSPSRLSPWRSNGGMHRGHPAKALPFSLEVALPSVGRVDRIHMLGVFATLADEGHEEPGTVGASIRLGEDNESLLRVDLVNGQNYCDARSRPWVHYVPGDGTSVETVGTAFLDGIQCRLDLLSIDVPTGPSPATLSFRDLGTPASFVICDVFAEMAPALGCPFHSGSGGVSLSDLGPILRVGDRVKFARALAQLEGSLLKAQDLDEARGEALTFLAVVTASTLELGGSRAMHRVQLEAAREMDRLKTVQEILSETKDRIQQVAPWLFEEPAGPNAALINRALSIVERNYAKPLTDAEVANQIGLSTSHFRYLFRQTTGQPFHKYLVAVRLEKARKMLVEQDVPVSAVAQAVGFTGLSHFSRAFSQRFTVSPNAIRRAAG
jgi:AraC-like DNA-binding protein